MNRTSIETILLRSADTILARLGHTHGYRFNSDTVRLGSMFTVVDAAAHSRAWALQLWACPEAPHANRLSGQLVAEVPLPPIGEIADDLESFEVNVPAVAPAGQRDHVMVLALVARRNGCFNEIHDLGVYAQREEFCLPRLGGTVGYWIAGDRVVLSAEHIENPRAAGSLSGTLALE